MCGHIQWECGRDGQQFTFTFFARFPKATMIHELPLQVEIPRSNPGCEQKTNQMPPKIVPIECVIYKHKLQGGVQYGTLGHHKYNCIPLLWQWQVMVVLWTQPSPTQPNRRKRLTHPSSVSTLVEPIVLRSYIYCLMWRLSLTSEQGFIWEGGKEGGRGSFPISSISPQFLQQDVRSH